MEADRPQALSPPHEVAAALSDSSFESVFTDHDQALRGYLRRRLKPHEDEQDYVQEVYLRVLAMAPGARAQIRNWPGFLRRAASNLLIDMSRRGSARRAAFQVGIEEALAIADDQAFDGERVALGRERMAEVERILAQLDHAARRALVAVRVQGLSHEEVASELGVARRDVSRLIERALYSLARQLARLDEPAP